MTLETFAFLYEKKKEREAAEDEVHQLLSDSYQDFLKTALEYPDLQLFSAEETPLTAELDRVGGLHARMVPARRFSRVAAGTPARRGPRLSQVHRNLAGKG